MVVGLKVPCLAIIQLFIIIIIILAFTPLLAGQLERGTGNGENGEGERHAAKEKNNNWRPTIVSVLYILSFVAKSNLFWSDLLYYNDALCIL